MVETVIVDQPANRIYIVGFEEVELFGNAGRCIALVAAIQTAIRFVLMFKNSNCHFFGEIAIGGPRPKFPFVHFVFFIQLG